MTSKTGASPSYHLGQSGPYVAVDAGGCFGWWYVAPADNRRLNILSFPDKPGACFTSKAQAQEIARLANEAGR